MGKCIKGTNGETCVTSASRNHVEQPSDPTEAVSVDKIVDVKHNEQSDSVSRPDVDCSASE